MRIGTFNEFIQESQLNEAKPVIVRRNGELQIVSDSELKDDDIKSYHTTRMEAKPELEKLQKQQRRK